jgi:hypothetical protein
MALEVEEESAEQGVNVQYEEQDAMGQVSEHHNAHVQWVGSG